MRHCIRRIALLLTAVLALGAARTQANVLTIPDLQTTPGSEIYIPVELTNTGDVVAMQFTVTLGDGLSFSGVPASTSRLSAHTVTPKLYNPQSMMVVVYSATNAPIDGRDGTVMTLPVAVGEIGAGEDSPVTLADVVLTDRSGNALSAEINSGSVSVAQEPDPVPDLAVSEVGVDLDTVDPEGLLTVSWKVSNRGLGATQAGWHENVHIVGPDGTKFSKTGINCSDFLAPAQAVVHTTTLALPPVVGFDGQCHVVVEIVPQGEDDNADNNTIVSDVTFYLTKKLYRDYETYLVSESDSDGRELIFEFTRSGSTASVEVLPVVQSVQDPRLDVPSEVVFEAGEYLTSLCIPFTANQIYDTNNQVVLTVGGNDTGYDPVDILIEIIDDALPSLKLICDSEEAREGQTVTFTLTTNCAPENDLTVEIYLQPADRAQAPATITLPAGESLTQFNVKLLENDIQGDDFGLVVVVVAEGYNAYAQTLYVVDSSPDEADLVPGNITFDKSVTDPGEKLTISWTVTNIGGKATQAGWSQIVTLVGADGAISSIIAGGDSPTILAPGESTDFFIPLTLPTWIGVDGECTLRVEITPYEDSGEPEANNGNNIAESEGRLYVNKKMFVSENIIEVNENEPKQTAVWVSHTGSTISAKPVNVELKPEDPRFYIPGGFIFEEGINSVQFVINIMANGRLDDNDEFELIFSSEDCESQSVHIHLIDDTLPGLTVECDRDTASEGQTVEFTLTAERVPVTDTEVKIDLDPADRVNGPAAVTLAAGEKSVGFEVTIPGNDTQGDGFELKVKASAEGYINAEKVITVIDISPDEADLVPGTVITDRASVAPEQSLRVSWTVSNTGGKATKAGWNERVTLVGPDGASVTLAEGSTDKTLDPGESTERSVEVILDRLVGVGGDCKVKVEITPAEGSGEPEANVGNNTAVAAGAVRVQKLLYLSETNVEVDESNAGSVALRVGRSGSTISAERFSVETASADQRLAIPGEVVFEQGATEAALIVEVNANQQADEDEEVLLTITGNGYLPVEVQFSIIDDYIEREVCQKPTATFEKLHVVLTPRNDGDRIWYTLDSTDPTVEDNTARTLYESPIPMDDDCRVRFYATRDNCSDSEVGQYDFVRADHTLAQPDLYPEYELRKVTAAHPMEAAEIIVHNGYTHSMVMSGESVDVWANLDRLEAYARDPEGEWFDSDIVELPLQFVAQPNVTHGGTYLHIEAPGSKRLNIWDGAGGKIYEGETTDELRYLGLGQVWYQAFADDKFASDPTSMGVPCFYDPGFEYAVPTVAVIGGNHLADAFGDIGFRDIDGNDLETLSVSGVTCDQEIEFVYYSIPSLRHLDLREAVHRVQTGDNLVDGPLPHPSDYTQLSTLVLPDRLNEEGVAEWAFPESLHALVYYGTEPLRHIFNPSNNGLMYVSDADVLLNSDRTNVVSGLETSELYCDRLQLNSGSHSGHISGGFYAPFAFTARVATYERVFEQESGAKDVEYRSKGWETISLPFDVDDFEHELRGRVVPFGAVTDHTDLTPNFWLYQADPEYGDGWKEAAAIEAGKPYIISMPCNEYYLYDYWLDGRMFFVGNNVNVEATRGQLKVDTWLDNFRLRATYQPVQDTAFYALNISDGSQSDEQGIPLAPGEAFVAGVATGDFSAYLDGATAMQTPRVMRVFGGAGVSGSEGAGTDRGLVVEVRGHSVVLLSASDREVSVYSVEGQLLRSVRLTGGERTVIDDLQPGVYLVGDTMVRL